MTRRLKSDLNSPGARLVVGYGSVSELPAPLFAAVLVVTTSMTRCIFLDPNCMVSCLSWTIRIRCIVFRMFTFWCLICPAYVAKRSTGHAVMRSKVKASLMASSAHGQGVVRRIGRKLNRVGAGRHLQYISLPDATLSDSGSSCPYITSLSRVEKGNERPTVPSQV